MAAMAQLYQMADAYVSPYAAEGFNLPALEAAACGLPLICTTGGPTDDFTTAEFALGIEAGAMPVPLPGMQGKALAVNFDSLVQQMKRVAEDSLFCEGARAFAPGFVAERFGWKSVVDKLLEVLLPRNV